MTTDHGKLGDLHELSRQHWNGKYAEAVKNSTTEALLAMCHYVLASDEKITTIHLEHSDQGDFLSYQHCSDDADTQYDVEDFEDELSILAWDLATDKPDSMDVWSNEAFYTNGGLGRSIEDVRINVRSAIETLEES